MRSWLLLLGLAVLTAVGCGRDTVEITREVVQTVGACAPPSCDDDNPCTEDACVDETCQHAPLAAGTRCWDDDVCNGEETCDGFGQCQPGTQKAAGADCSDGVFCNGAETCDGQGTCQSPPSGLPQGSPCPDGDVCNGNETCDGNGTCVPGPPAAAGTSCSDGALCNGAETCDGQGQCQAGAAPIGEPCWDDNPCTGPDLCTSSGACAGALLTGSGCDDGNPCTTGDTCTEASRCQGAPAAQGSCADTDLCNGAESCVEGVCVPGSPPLIDDGDPKTLDVCDPSTGQVAHAPCGDFDLTVATGMDQLAECYYPLIVGLTRPIDPTRIAAIAGRVLSRDGAPIQGVKVWITDEEVDGYSYGHTFTRPDGRFNLVVNGGRSFTLAHERDQYLPATRRVNVPVHAFGEAPDVALILKDPVATQVALDAGSFQVARGSLTNDQRGLRQATILVPPGTTITSNPNLDTVHIRASEYTVGPNGPLAMPAPLPPNSGYTYAVELSVDEPDAQGQNGHVEFSQPVVAHLENFLGFPVGTIVPSGYYEPSKNAWIAGPSGCVIRIASIADGKAVLDVGASPSPPCQAAAQASDGERARLATLYAPGQTLWRVTISHFTIWDWNWGWGPPSDATYANAGDPHQDNPIDQACEQLGSIIECENRTLGEAFPIAGSPFRLHYQSDRTRGYQSLIEVPLKTANVPPSMLKGEANIRFDGIQIGAVVFGPQPAPLTWHTSWDSVLPGSQEPLQGANPVVVRVGYQYEAVPTGTSTFGENGDGTAIEIDAATQIVTLWRTWSVDVGHWQALPQGLGGFSLSAHHVYDPGGKVLYYGDGSRRSAQSVNGGAPSLKALATLQVTSVAWAPDGGFFAASEGDYRVYRMSPEGELEAYAGNGIFCFGGQTNTACGDGGPPLGASIHPRDLALAPDGTLYIADGQGHRVWRVTAEVDPNLRTIHVIAGDGTDGFSGDGGPSTGAKLSWAAGVAVGPEGAVYIADSGNNRIRRITQDGLIHTVAGSAANCSPYYQAEPGQPDPCGDEGPAVNAELHVPRDVDVGPDGTIYIADHYTCRVRAVTPDGVMHTVTGLVGGGEASVAVGLGDGEAANAARILRPTGVVLAPDGSLYVMHQTSYLMDDVNDVVRRISPPLVVGSGANGTITTVAGGGCVEGSPPQSEVDGGPAVGACLKGLQSGSASAAGAILLADLGRWKVFRLAPVFPGAGTNEITMVSEDGLELYVFDGQGRHQSTKDILTGQTLYAFSYDAEGRLASVADAFGRVTSILRTAEGAFAGIQAPASQGGKVTAIELYGQAAGLNAGYIKKITNPAGEAYAFEYDPDGPGLLTKLTDPEGHETTFAYDEVGRLISDTGPGMGPKLLSEAPIADGKVASVTTTLSAQQSVTTQHTYARDPDSGKTVRGVYPPASFYDVATRTLTETTPLGRTSTRTPDALGRLSTAAAADIAPVTLTYYPDEEPNVAARKRLWKVTQAPQGQPGEARETVFTYDAFGRVATVTDPVGRVVSFGYDAANRVTSQTLPGARTVSFAYDDRGGLTSLMPPGKPEHTFDLTALASRASSEPVYAVTYLRDKLGRITQRTETIGAAQPVTHAYTYWPEGWLEQVTKTVGAGSPEPVGYHVYDDNGNRTQRGTTPQNLPITGSYDAQDRLTSYGTAQSFATYAHTAVGDRASKLDAQGAVTYTYDAYGSLRKVTFQSAPEVNYEVDPAGRRVGRKHNGATTRWTYGGAYGPAAELDAQGTVTKRFVYATRGHVPDYVVDPSGQTPAVYRILTDQLGSPRVVVEAATGEVVQRIAYDELGAATHESGLPLDWLPFGFAGGLFDPATNLLRFGARDYDPHVGRWTAKDPIRFAGGDANLYGYVVGDPVNLIDPAGTCPLCIAAFWTFVAAAPFTVASESDVMPLATGVGYAALAISSATAAATLAARAAAMTCGGAASASAVTAQAARGTQGAASPILTFTERNLQKGFTKHGADFGLSGNWNPGRAADFSRAINQHINDPAVTAISGTYRGAPVTHYFNPATGVNVIADPAGNFVSGWRLGVQQMENLFRAGALQ